MTLEEAQQVARIVSHADGGCGHCIAPLLVRLEKAFPAFVWTYDPKATEPLEPPESAGWEAEERWYEERRECRVLVRDR